ncbi:MAG: glucose-1-phosphate adenylyltransferase subunit GlgD, partial [Clostridia bacterium]|nr:glucose-1-phosphate adenylyltransferase subunit GlgD [Clostridia bacterium]
MKSTVGVIFSSINDDMVAELTKVRSKGSIPYGGRYRLVDFALSNMVNSGITTVGMLTKDNYQSLMDHLGSGKEWDLARKEGGLILLPPFSDESETLYNNRLEGLKSASAFLKKAKEDFVVIADSDAVYKLDYSKVIEQHVATNADITLVYHEHEAEDSSYMVFDTEKDGKIKSIDVNVQVKGVKKHYINVLVARTSYLLSVLQTAISRGYKSFSQAVILPGLKGSRIYGYKLEGYYQNIESLHTYFKANMDLLDKKVR